MLALIENTNFKQVILKGEKAKRIFRAIEYLDKVAVNHISYSVLVLYTRLNPSGIYEAGIYFGPGPFCDNRDSFPVEMLRVFSLDNQSFNLVGDYYVQLVEKEFFCYIDSSEINYYN